MAYQYLAATADGRVVRGVLDTRLEEEAEEALSRAGYKVLSLRRATTRPPLYQMLPSLFGVRQQDVVTFARQLAVLLEAGTPLLRALQLLEEQGERASLKAVFRRIALEVEHGTTLSDALAGQGKAFPGIFIRLVQMGEQSGRLEEALRQVAGYLEAERRVAKKVSAAMVYPAIVLTLAAGVMALMVTVVIPPLSDLFKVFKTELPPTTRAVLAVSDFLRAYFVYVGLCGLGAVAAAIMGLRTAGGRHWADGMILKVPVLGRLALHRAVGRSARMASMLLQAGVPVQEVLQLLAESNGNSVVRDSILRTRSSVLNGSRLAAGLAQSALATPLFIQMVRVGEEAGTLGHTLESAAKFYEEAVEERIAALIGLLEPAMTLGVGAVVGFLAVSVVMPIFSLAGSIK